MCPEVPMSSVLFLVLFLVSYACDAASWFVQQSNLAQDADFADVVAIILDRIVVHVTMVGLLNG
jgi:hypothetical protein